MIRTLGDTADAPNDASNAILDASSTGAGWTKGFLGSRLVNPGIPITYDTALIADREWVYRSNGNPFGDSDDIVSTLHTDLLPYVDSGNLGSFLVQPTVVPLPAAAWLFGSALLGLVGIKRKQRKRR